jgi:uncharacterized protein
MSPAVRNGIKSLISKRAALGLDNIDLNWFGGEPLLALHAIRDITAHAKSIADQFKISLSGGFTTNAYLLTRDLVEEFARVGHDFYQVSLDGWESTHDETRKRADGRGTFKRIWENLLLIREAVCNFDILLRVHVSPNNIESLKTLCEQIRENFSGDSRFRVNFQDIRPMGGPGARNVKPMRGDEFKQAVSVLSTILNSADDNGGISNVTSKGGSEDSINKSEISDAAQKEPYVCYAAKPNHFLIRSDGRVGRCTVFLDDPRNFVGNLGEDGCIKLDDDKLRLWFRGFESLDPVVLGCPIHAIRNENYEDGEIPVKLV